jgi:hypothetical protein
MVELFVLVFQSGVDLDSLVSVDSADPEQKSSSFKARKEEKK